MRTACFAAMAALTLPALATPALAEAAQLRVIAGRSTILDAPGALERVAVSDPKIAGVRVVGGRQLLVNGLSPGSTTLMVWPKGGGVRQWTVQVELDATLVERQVREATGNNGLRVAFDGRSWLLSGTATTVSQRQIAEKVVANYGQPVVNMIYPSGRREQIAIAIHVVELARTASLRLGYTVGGAETTGMSNGVRNYIFKPGEIMMGETGPGGFPGNLGGIDLLAARIEALQSRGEAKLLARPTLVTTDGGTARFLAGGEIPIPIPQALGVTTITWKEFGVRLEIQPTLGQGGHITLAVKPEVSSLDFANGLKQATFTIPAIKTRRLETTVTLAPSETLMLGGLLNNEESRSFDGLPGLSDIPVLGELFKSRRFIDNQSELAILVTPQMMAPEQGMQPPGRLREIQRDLGGGAR